MWDELFARSPVGRHYTALYEKHASEVARLLAADPQLAAQAATLLRRWRPAVEGLVAAQQGVAVSTEATQRVVRVQEVTAARAVLQALAKRGSPQLRADLEPVLAQIEGFAGRTPAEIWAVLTRAERRVYLPVVLRGWGGQQPGRKVWPVAMPGNSAGANVDDMPSPAGAITTTRVISYTYDPLGRLVEADYSTGERFEYRYDAVGNRTAMTDTDGVHTYTYDSANRLTSVDGVAYTWDARGNLVSDGRFTYAYSSAGRMVRAAEL